MMNNYSWAADLVNPQQVSSNSSTLNLNKHNDEALTAIVNSLTNNEEETVSVNPRVGGPGLGKELSKLFEQYLQGKENESSMDGKDETGCKIDIQGKNGKDLDRASMIHDVEESKNVNNPSMIHDVDESKNLKRNLGCSADQPVKYQRLGDEGKIVSGYYTPIVDEKLFGFQSTYINIGSPRCVKEVVGIRKNSQFVTTGKKKSGTPPTPGSYLVVSFENRNKSNSPFVEYPIKKLGSIIKALEELRERMSKQGYYSEPKIIKCQYPENTIITDKNYKETIIQTID